MSGYEADFRKKLSPDLNRALTTVLARAQELAIKELEASLSQKHAEIERLRGALTCRYCGSLEWTISTYGRVLHKQACPYNQSAPDSSTERRE